MARTSEQLTQAEIDAYQKFCTEHNIIADETDAGKKNGDLIGTYITITWGEDITPYTLNVALEKLRDQIQVYTPAEAAYRKVALEDPARANQLHKWFESPANKQLIASGEEGFANEAAILADLRGRDINQKTIQESIGRVAYNHGRLHYVPTPRQSDPRQHKDDGKGFAPKSETNLTARDHARKAAEARGEPTPAQAKPTEKDTWQEVCERMLRNGSHGQQAAQKQLFDNKGTKSWRQLYSEMEAVARSYQRLVNPKAV